jgi:hypothetical protein
MRKAACAGAAGAVKNKKLQCYNSAQNASRSLVCVAAWWNPCLWTEPEGNAGPSASRVPWGSVEAGWWGARGSEDASSASAGQERRR